jgi:flagellar basal-body rod protein FlgC
VGQRWGGKPGQALMMSNVNEMSEMVDMMAAARSYQNNVEVVNTARQLTMRTLDIIKA